MAWGVLASGQDEKSKRTVTPEPVTVTITSADNSEVAALKAQLETMRFYDQRLLYTVYWSLGTVAAIAILLSGFSWYANFRMYERDRTALLKELQTFVAEEFSKTRAELQAGEKKINEAIPSISDSVKKQFAQDVTALRNAIKSETSKVEDRCKEALYEFQMDMYEFLGNYHEEHQNPYGAWQSYKNFLSAAIKWESSYRIMRAVEGLKRVVRKGKKLSAIEYSDIAPMIEKVPDKFKEEIEPTLNLLRAARE